MGCGKRFFGENGIQQTTANTGALHFVQDDDLKQTTTDPCGMANKSAGNDKGNNNCDGNSNDR